MEMDQFEITKIYSLPQHSDAPKERMIEVNKKLSLAKKPFVQKTKRERCWICGAKYSGFCKSHSIPAFVLRNIGEDSEVSHPRQADSPEPHKNTGIASAGIFRNICSICDSKVFRSYEDEPMYDTFPTPEMLSAIALKNCLKVTYEREMEVEEERFYRTLSGVPELVLNEGKSPAEYAVKEFRREIDYALKAVASPKKDSYHLYYYKKLDYKVPFAAQYPIAMLADLDGAVIHNFYTGSNAYRLQYLHIAIFPLQKSSILLIFGAKDDNRHRKFIKQLKKLEEEDQLSVINFLTFSGAENIFLNKTTYAKVSKDPAFMDICRLTYAIWSNVPNPSDPLAVAIREHSFQKRHTIPNLLSPEYAIKADREK